MGNNWTTEDFARIFANAHGLVSRAIVNHEPPYEAQAYLHYFLGWDLGDLDNPVDIRDLLAQFPNSPDTPFQQTVTVEYLAGDFDGYLYPADRPNSMYVRWLSPFGWVLLMVYLPVQGGWREGAQVVANLSADDYAGLLDRAYQYSLN